MRPFIGITVNTSFDDAIGIETHIGGPGQSWQLLAQDYISAVEAAGGVPVLVPVLTHPEQRETYLERLDGILFSGGCDLNPKLYDKPMDPAVGLTDPDRDEQELFLMQQALRDTKLAVLGICRGCQMMNVACGGTLVQDMNKDETGNHFFPQQPMRVPVHKISTVADSRIETLLGKTAWVNSYHHQCVDECGEGLQITATDAHGVPESIEMPEREAFTLGVQWHPEGMALTDPEQMKIIRAFVSAAARAE